MVCYFWKFNFNQQLLFHAIFSKPIYFYFLHGESIIRQEIQHVCILDKFLKCNLILEYFVVCDKKEKCESALIFNEFTYKLWLELHTTFVVY